MGGGAVTPARHGARGAVRRGTVDAAWIGTVCGVALGWAKVTGPGGAIRAAAGEGSGLCGNPTDAAVVSAAIGRSGPPARQMRVVAVMDPGLVAVSAAQWPPW